MCQTGGVGSVATQLVPHHVFGAQQRFSERCLRQLPASPTPPWMRLTYLGPNYTARHVGAIIKRRWNAHCLRQERYEMRRILDGPITATPFEFGC